MNIYETLKANKTYIFRYSVPWQNPIINNWGLQNELTKYLGKLARFEVYILGHIKIYLTPYQDGGTAETWADNIKIIIDNYLWGETEFLGVDEYTSWTESVITPVVQTAKGIYWSAILPLVLIAVIIFLWGRYGTVWK